MLYTALYMSSVRTQIYLTEEQRHRIDAVAQAEGVPMAEVIRRALDRYLGEVAPDAEDALAATFGAVRDMSAPGRDEWDRG